MYTFIDLFAGAGGLSLGFVKTGRFRPLVAIELDRDARRTYALNFHGGDAGKVLEDITKVQPWDLPSEPDVMIGGPPCQDFTQLTAVRQEVSRKRNDLLWKHYIELVIALKPKVFVIENVPNLLTDSEYEAQRQSLSERLQEEGYKVTWGILNAAAFGVPQARQRAFVIGTRLPGVRPFLPFPTLEPKTAWEAISDLAQEPPGPPPRTKLERPVAELHLGRRPQLLSRLRYRYVLPDGNRMHLPEPITIKTWVNKKNGTSDGFGRVYALRPSCTIRCEGFKPEKGRFLHPFENRPLTLAEMARLQTFPDDFIFFGTYTSIAKQIGNAVPPLMGYHIARAVLDMLDGNTQDVAYPPEETAASVHLTGGNQTAERVLRLLQTKRGKPVPWWEIDQIVRRRARPGTVDWGTPLLDLVTAGYDITAGSGDGLKKGEYRLNTPGPIDPLQTPNVARVGSFVLARHTACQGCGRTDRPLTPVLARRVEKGRQPLPDFFDVLCQECLAKYELDRARGYSQKELEVYRWLSNYRHYKPVARILFETVGLSPDQVQDGPPPPEDPEVLKRAEATAEKCDLCGVERQPGFRAELIRPVSAGGLLHRDNVWVLCPICQEELAQERIKIPSPNAEKGKKDKGRSVPLRERFAEPGFLTLREAEYRNWLLLHLKDPLVRERARNTLLKGDWNDGLNGSTMEGTKGR